MIAENPPLRHVFSKSAQDTGHQADALAGALYAYATNINDLSPLIPVVVRIAHKHAAHGITGEQYGIVGTYLIRTLCEYFGDAFTEELKVAWYNVGLSSPLLMISYFLYLSLLLARHSH